MIIFEIMFIGSYNFLSISVQFWEEDEKCATNWGKGSDRTENYGART